MTDCTCGHGDLPAHFHMTPCPIKTAHLATVRDGRHDEEGPRETIRVLVQNALFDHMVGVNTWNADDAGDLSEAVMNEIWPTLTETEN